MLYHRDRCVTRRGIIQVFTVAACTLGLAGCNSAPRTIRYRVTLEVETPEGMRIGSGVSESEMYFNDGALSGLGNAISFGVRAQAIVVDLGARGLLFMLLTGDPTRKDSPIEPSYFISTAPWGFVRANGADEGTPAFYDWLNTYKPKATLALERLPMLAHFRNINDPRTVENVDPRNLAATFGAGVHLRRATIEITGDPVTTGIEKYAPSFGDLSDFNAWYRSLHHGDPRQFRPEALKEGF